MYYTFQSLPNSDKGKLLVTTGAYSYVRHPLYAAGIFCLFPAITLLARDWMILFAGLLLLISAHNLVRVEEKALLGVFGDKYESYRRNVPALIPYKLKNKS